MRGGGTSARARRHPAHATGPGTQAPPTLKPTYTLTTLDSQYKREHPLAVHGAVAAHKSRVMQHASRKGSGGWVLKSSRCSRGCSAGLGLRSGASDTAWLGMPRGVWHAQSACSFGSPSLRTRQPYLSPLATTYILSVACVLPRARCGARTQCTHGQITTTWQGHPRAARSSSCLGR